MSLSRRIDSGDVFNTQGLSSPPWVDSHGYLYENSAALKISFHARTWLDKLLRGKEPRLSFVQSLFLLMVLKHRILAIAGFLGIMVVLGVFVNALFLTVALASLCGITHLLGGHHGGAEHRHDMAREQKETEPSVSGS